MLILFRRNTRRVLGDPHGAKDKKHNGRGQQVPFHDAVKWGARHDAASQKKDTASNDP